MTPYYADDLVTLYHGDCLDVLPQLAATSVDAVVTDPPYDLTAGKKGGTGTASVNLDSPYGRSRIGTGNGSGGFMGKAWDATGVAFNPATWVEVLRVLKPGGHLLAFGGTRTWHRLACAIEDAGFEIRDSIAWLYGSGFPKSLDVSKAIDRAAGAEREVVGPYREAGRKPNGSASQHSVGLGDRPGTQMVETAPATPDAARWQGWGTALKPAHEPIVVARKPLAGTVAANVLAHGTGTLNIDGCRIGFASEADERESKDKNQHADFGTTPGGNAVYGDYSMVAAKNYNPPGRWPANVVLDETQAAELDRQSGVSTSTVREPTGRDTRGIPNGNTPVIRIADTEQRGVADTGGASRFYYVAKAPTDERPRDGVTAHPTVKPLNLMRWLVRLVTPPGGLVLDPFAGTGTTAEACIVEGFHCIAIEREADYLPLIVARLTKPIQPDIFGGAA